MKPPKFKMTELGPLPEDWEVKRLGEVAPFQRGFDLPTSQIHHGNVPVVYSNGIGNFHNRAMCMGPGLVTGRSGTIGEFTYIEEGPYWPHNTTLWVTHFSSCDPLFAFYKFKTIEFANFSTGTGVPTLNRNNIHQHLIALPPLLEQHRIAAALSDVDELISALGKLIEKKRNIKTGTMQQLLTGKRRLPGFGGKWVEKRLGEIGKFSKGAGISKEQSNSGPLPAVRYGELYTTHHDYIKHFESHISEDVAKCATQLHEGDIVFACSGETKEEIGKCAAYLGKEVAYAGGDLIIFTPTAEYDSLFLGLELNTPFCAQQKAAAGQGDAVVHIRQESIAAITVFVPPILPEQRAIAAVLSDMDAEIAALEAEQAKYARIKSGMMQQLLTGKTRLEHDRRS